MFYINEPYKIIHKEKEVTNDSEVTFVLVEQHETQYLLVEYNEDLNICKDAYTVKDNLDLDERVPIVWTRPMTIDECNFLAYENGYIIGTIIMDLFELISNNREVVLHRMSEKLIDTTHLSTIHYRVVNIHAIGIMVNQIIIEVTCKPEKKT